MATVYVCRKCTGSALIIDHLARYTAVEVCPVGCQKVCSNNVVGVRRDGTIVWFQRLDTDKHRRALARYVRGDHGETVPKRLRSLTVSKRGGRVRR